MEMCAVTGVNLQRGMNFQLHNKQSVLLMSVRPGAPYADRIEHEGRILIYEGHDCARTANGPDPKAVDQPRSNPGGSLTQNGLFARAAQEFKENKRSPEKVRVYEKLHSGIWVYNGLFDLIDYWTEISQGRSVFKFKLKLCTEDDRFNQPIVSSTSDDDRMIPSWVKLEVWKRDQGKCCKCGTKNGLHFDHIIPYSKGGSSKEPLNIQILCGRHNLEKRDNIE